MAPPELWIVAGPNGAGKTTLVQAHPIRALLPGVRFFNPDDAACAVLLKQGYRGFADAPETALRKAFVTAANTVAAELEGALQRAQPVGVETVLSSEKYRAPVEFVRERGGFVGLIYVALVSPDLACARVARRVRAAGHAVPPEKIRARWNRSLENLAWFALHASAFWIFDNSDENPDTPPQLVAVGRHGQLDSAEPSLFPALRAALAGIPGPAAA